MNVVYLMRREWQLKQLTREEKLKLINGDG